MDGCVLAENINKITNLKTKNYVLFTYGSFHLYGTTPFIPKINNR